MRTFLLNLKTGFKLGAAFLLVTLGFISLLWFTLEALGQLNANTALITERYYPRLDAVKEARIHFNNARAALLAATAVEDLTRRSMYLQQVKERSQAYEDELTKLKGLSDGDPKALEFLTRIELLWLEFHQARDVQLKLIDSGDIEAAKALIIGEQSEREATMRAITRELSDLIERQVAKIIADGVELNRKIEFTYLVVGGALIIVTLLLSWLLRRAIVEPLSLLTQWAQQISMGELPQDMRVAPREDEVGQLGQAFARMIESLRELIREMQEGVTVLATASEEIMASVSQAATSTQETATAISEIATTVEEVKQTAVMASDKAKSVSASTEITRKVANEGRLSVDETLQGMGQVRDQMQAIGESIMSLSEQTQTVGEIVAAVNDLAEQSNLLGVNASIEAVKAGDAGKGFSVVAQEVKVLAEQSKKATAQVRAILGDVQKAMTKAVMVAEQGSKTVDVGVQRAQTSGAAIRTLTDNVTESSDMAMQIAATSQQQMVGMDQVVVAMDSIRIASQGSVNGIRQVEQAARNLHQLGGRLKLSAARFKL